jgi:hypothetical protein
VLRPTTGFKKPLREFASITFFSFSLTSSATNLKPALLADLAASNKNPKNAKFFSPKGPILAENDLGWGYVF